MRHRAPTWVGGSLAVATLIAMIVAVRQALDYEGAGGTARAIAVCAIGFPIYVLLLMTALLALGPWPI